MMVLGSELRSRYYLCLHGTAIMFLVLTLLSIWHSVADSRRQLDLYRWSGNSRLILANFGVHWPLLLSFIVF
jgi:hypothetical protein